MATTRHISHRIKGIKNIQHITKAMKMVAAARLKRAHSRLESARPYAQRMADVALDLASLNAGEGNTFLKPRPNPQRPLIVLFTGDRGLCGGFHERVVEFSLALAKEMPQGPAAGYYVVGRQGARIMRRMRIDVDKVYPDGTRGVTYTAAKALADELMGMYRQGRYGSIHLVFSKFQSALVQKPRVFQLLPVASPLAKKQPPKGYFLFEPSAGELLESILADYVASEVFRAFLECETGELGARMSAMTNATDSAGKMILRLVLDYNRARQASITREISEIVGGAETQKT